MLKMILSGILALWCGLACAAEDIQVCAPIPDVTQPGVRGCYPIIQPQGTASAVESYHVLKVGPANVQGFQVNNTNASMRWVMLFDSATVPVDGPVTGCTNPAAARPCVAKWYQVSGTTPLGVMWAPGPALGLNAGAVLVCSSSGPFTLMLAADCTFSGETM